MPVFPLYSSTFTHFSFSLGYDPLPLFPDARCCNEASRHRHVAKFRGAITTRKRKDGSIGYIAQVRIMQQGATVYQESKTFDRKTTAQAWIKKVETAMAEPSAIAKAKRAGVSAKDMIDRYLLEYEKLRPRCKTKRATLRAIGESWLGQLTDAEITSQKLVEFANDRMRKDGDQAQTVGNDLAHFAAVLAVARPEVRQRRVVLCAR